MNDGMNELKWKKTEMNEWTHMKIWMNEWMKWTKPMNQWKGMKSMNDMQGRKEGMKEGMSEMNGMKGMNGIDEIDGIKQWSEWMEWMMESIWNSESNKLNLSMDINGMSRNGVNWMNMNRMNGIIHWMNVSIEFLSWMKWMTYINKWNGMEWHVT